MPPRSDVQIARFLVRNVLLALAFSLLYLLCYERFLNQFFDYLGFPFYKKDVFFLFISLFIVILPLFFYRGFISLSSYISIFIYIILYIPTILTFAVGSSLPMHQILLIQVIFLGGMCIFFLADTIQFSLKVRISLLRIEYVLFATILSCLYIIWVYRGNLQFVGIEDVYVQRLSNEGIGSDVISRYLIVWLATVFAPLCIIYGILNSKGLYLIIGIVACIVVYMAYAPKWVIMLPFILGALSFVFRNGRHEHMYNILIIMLALPMLIIILVSPEPDNGFFLFSSIFLMRTVGQGGSLNLVYHDFFSNHPQTYYSHINIVNKITGAYPYKDLQIGQVVGQNIWSEEMNSNANFWATDGFAAMGLTGLALSSLLLFFLLLLLNASSKRYNKQFLIMAFIPFLLFLLNTSLFSTMWTGGGIFLLLFMLLSRNEPAFLNKENRV